MEAGRLSGSEKDTRDLLLYYILRARRLTNAQIGEELSLSYSALSHALASIEAKLQNDQGLRASFNRLNSVPIQRFVAGIDIFRAPAIMNASYFMNGILLTLSR